MIVTVRTQAALDKAIADKAETIYIDSPDSIRLCLTDSDSSHVVARGSSHVVVDGSSHVDAWGSSHVDAWDSSHVVARGSSHVVARGSSHVVAWGISHVDAWGSSHVVARGSSHVDAWDSAHVDAWDSSHVDARDSSHVDARKYVGVHLHSQRVTLTGEGQVIDLTEIKFEDPAQWFEFHGVEVADGIAYVFKAVDDNWMSDYGANYAPGSTPAAEDWAATDVCGNGLHFCAHPQLSLGYKRDATKFVKAGVRVDETVCLGDKIKSRRVVVACAEVDSYGKPVE